MCTVPVYVLLQLKAVERYFFVNFKKYYKIWNPRFLHRHTVLYIYTVLYVNKNLKGMTTMPMPICKYQTRAIRIITGIGIVFVYKRSNSFRGVVHVPYCRPASSNVVLDEQNDDPTRTSFNVQRPTSNLQPPTSNLRPVYTT